ncbi:hypothetical protein WG906_07855 [Pedobacter sp. P351]|uniref:hypothetical protein n=1 Tax=Pedobacter superstes TaxID=3133441 RepID=UPI0030AED883
MKSIFSTILIFISLTIKAQHSVPVNTKERFNIYLDSLKALSFKVINSPAEPERYNANYTMVKTLVSALKLPNSFNFSFDSLKTISVLTSPDRRFRLFTWHIMNQDGSYRYYGTVQMNNPSGKLQMFPLVDNTHTYKKPQDTITSNENWYGSQYYKIIPVLYNVRTPYYILLGWKGNNVKSTKKVIEVLSFKENKAVFGMPVFDGDKERSGKNRIVYEYNRQVSFMLNYLPKEGTIVFDHLAPPDPKLQDKPELFGPDMSYDGYKLVNGRWKYVSDLQLKNSPSETDEIYNDPKKPSKNVVNKLK